MSCELAEECGEEEDAETETERSDHSCRRDSYEKSTAVNYRMRWLIGDENPDPDEYILIIGRDYIFNPVLQKYNDLEDVWYPEFTLKCLYQTQPFALHGTKVYTFVPDIEGVRREGPLFIFDLATGDLHDLRETNIPCFTSGKSLANCIYCVTKNGEIFAFNTDDNTISSCLALNTSSEMESQYQIVINKGIIYVFGEFEDQSACKSFDPETRQVKEMAPFPLPHELRCEEKPGVKIKISATEHLGKIYAIEEDSISELFEYDPEEDSWQTIQPEQPLSISFGKLISHKGRLLCIDRYCTVSHYNEDSNEWNHKTDCEGSLMFDDRSDVISAIYSITKDQN